MSKKQKPAPFLCVPRFRLAHARVTLAGDYETPTGVSMTEPGQGVSLKDLLQRFTRFGTTIDPSQMRRGYYSPSEFDDEDLEQFAKADIVDQTEIINDVTSRLQGATGDVPPSSSPSPVSQQSSTTTQQHNTPPPAPAPTDPGTLSGTK